jgi:hypothetical protein
LSEVLIVQKILPKALRRPRAEFGQRGVDRGKFHCAPSMREGGGAWRVGSGFWNSMIDSGGTLSITFLSRR